MGKFIREEIERLKPYDVIPADGMVKLDANENPYDLPLSVKEHVLQEIVKISFNRYPDPYAVALRKKIAENLSVTPEMLCVGNGSDELLFYVSIAFAGNTGSFVVPVPSFAMYSFIPEIMGCGITEIPLKEEYQLDADAIIRDSGNTEHTVILIGFPNNPTGNCYREDDIIRIIENTDRIVVVDEAYYEFSRKTFIGALTEYKNVLILRTFSKAFGLAGLRVGYCIGNEELISALMKVKMPYNVNALSQASAVACLANKEIFSKMIDRIIKERDILIEKMKGIGGITVFPTDSNFILFKTGKSASDVFDKLIENGILIRNVDDGKLLKDCLRVTTGKPEENEKFINALSNILT